MTEAETSPTARCPLCLSGPEEEDGSRPRLTGWNRLDYLLCPECRLIFAFPAPAVSAGAERARYLLHRNSIRDEGYVRFLHRLWDPVRLWLDPGMRGLDFGCGPAPVLAGIVRAAGFACDAYDPLFPQAGGPAAGAAPGYEFILCSEVFEHFQRVGEEIARLLSRLTPGGILGVMTEFWREAGSFSRWPYTSDPTHRSFFHAQTFDWIARRYGLERLEDDGQRVVIFRYKPAETAGVRPSGERSPAPVPRGPEIQPG